MKVSRSVRKTSVFVLSWDDVTELVDRFSARLSHVSVSTQCSDELTRQFSDLQELKQFANPARSAIRELRVVGRTADYINGAEVTFTSDDKNNARFSVDADEPIAVELNDYFEDLLDRLRPWYARVATADWSNAIILFVVVVALGKLVPALRSGGVSLHKVAGEMKDAPWVGLGVLMALVSVGLAAVTARFRRKFFPTGTFAFGDGERRYAATEVWRTAIVASFVVSVIASVFVSWFL